MSYASEHAGAHKDVAAAGAAVTFSLADAGTYDPATGLHSGTAAETVSAVAMQVAGNPKEYDRLALVESEAPTLFVVPDTYGARVPLNARVAWSGADYTVRSEAPFAPDGTAIFAHVVIAR